jgi:hypothetical protein
MKENRLSVVSTLCDVVHPAWDHNAATACHLVCCFTTRRIISEKKWCQAKVLPISRQKPHGSLVKMVKP